jgi:hypothetical protein
VEIAVGRHWDAIQVTEVQRERHKQVIHDHHDGLVEVARREVARASQRLDALDDEEAKLLQRHYASKASERLYDREFDRIQDERATAERTLEQVGINYDEILEQMEVAIDLTKDIAAAYWNASPVERRFLNQAFFERLEMEDDVSGSIKAEPFRTLLDPDFVAKVDQAGAPSRH